MRYVTTLMLVILGLGLLPACGGSDDYMEDPAANNPPPLEPARARAFTDKEANALMGSRCVSCHSTDRVKKYAGGRAGLADWTARVDKCQAKSGAVPIPPVEHASLIKWLAKTYGE